MASTILTIALAVASVNGHAFFHKASVNGVDQGQLFGVRAPSTNNPIQDVTSSAITCNAPLNQPVSKDVISIAPGDTFGMQWNHNIGGPTAGDGDDPIAASHHGPMMAYMAKVDDAASSDGTGLKWFKVAEEGLNTATGVWGVDTMVAQNGLWDFKMPNLAPGEYLLRGEALALHSAGSSGGAQFYMSCAAIKVTGSGTCAPSDTVSFPGAYKADDAGILISIYGNDGKPNNGGKPYTAPGPKVVDCGAAGSGSSKPTTTAAATTAKTTTAAATTKPSTTYAPTTMSTVTRPATTSKQAIPPSSLSLSQTTAVTTTVAAVTSTKPAVTFTTTVAPTSTTGGAIPTQTNKGKKFVCYEIDE